METLTQRQLEILNLVKFGYTNKAIAYKLGLSLSTIKGVITISILPKLKAENRAHATYIAMKIGIIN